MADRTLSDVARETGKTLGAVQKDAQRGKLVTERRGTVLVVTQTGFDAYVGAAGLRQAADAVEKAGSVREAGQHISRLPAHVLDAILAGTPKEKPTKAGSSTAFLAATKDLPKNPPVVEPDDEHPHGAAPIGHVWFDSPRWKRVSEATWAIGEARYTWNGLFWEGEGLVEGRQLADGISPANPYSDKRPIQPAKADPKKK